MLWIVFALAGAAVGALLPKAADSLAAWKMRKKDKPLASAPLYTSLAACILCALVNGAGWGLCWKFGTPVTAALAMLLWACGTVLILLDIRLRIIPNELLLAMLLLGLPLQFLAQGFDGLFRAAGAMIAVMIVCISLGNFMGLYKIGAGDVKLAAVMALTLGMPALVWAMAAMAGSMFLFCGVGIALRKMTLKSMLPFGPFLIVAFWVGLAVLLTL